MLFCEAAAIRVSLWSMIISPFFTFSGPSPSEATSLSDQQIIQLMSAVNYHSLTNPGANITFEVAIGEITQIPALTDSSTESSDAIAGSTSHSSYEGRSNALGVLATGPVTRHIRLSHPDASPATTRPPEQFSVPRRAYRALETRAPLLLDGIREFLMRRREKATSKQIPPYELDSIEGTVQKTFRSWQALPAPAPAQAPKAVLFGLHWLQTGGAERWAVESIQIAKDAGFLPVVITDQNSVHPWADRPELDGAIVITLSFNHHEHEIDVRFMQAILENLNLVGIMMHHSHYLYQMLPWITQHRPELHVVDSLHIVEYLAGGYPGSAVHFDEYIDTHHVISPQLVGWLTDTQSIAPEKIALAPLASLTVDSLGGFATRERGTPFTIAFVGRLSRQKRPDVFLGLVHRLRKQGLNFNAILHGDGEMRNIVGGLIKQFGLEDVIEQRFEDTPVSETLRQSDALIVTSINEGLTLTTFEAIAAGIPVISSDVGSQHTIVQGGTLLPRPARPFIRGAASLVARFDSDEQLRELLWREQRDRVKDFSALPSAHQWMKEHFESWQV